jgi:eukaryotic-like serine/threonine-protein kinase
MSDPSIDFRERLQAALGSVYRIERELGGGGMSRVFVAEETSLGRKVVVKVLSPELAAELSAERFEREVRLAAQLQHPQIVPVLTAGNAGGVPYYTMPLVEGESLRAHLARDGAQPIPKVVSVLRDVAKALEFAHARGVVHRDIKPDNVLLSGSSAAVTDFGIAKALSASKAEAHATLTQMGTSIGTPAYMAPEQAAGDPNTDHRADFYAFGCMAYELLTGSPPFGDRPPHQLIVAHISETPVPVEQRRVETPRSLARLVMRCLEKSPDERPQSAGELLAALDAAITSAPVIRASDGMSRRSRRRLAGGIAALVVLAVAGFAWTRRMTKPVDEQVIAVLPFRVAGADPSLHYLREGMLDLLSARLAASTGVRSVDSRTVLAAWHKAGGDDHADVPEDESRRVASRIGAGQLLVGDIVGSAKQITLHAALVGAADAKRSDATVTGSVDSLQTLVDRLTAELLTRRAGEASRLANLTSTSLPALRAYLDGQANYRRGRWEAAANAFNTALDADTSFGLAALGVIQASRWFQQTRDVARANRIGWRLRDRFTPRDRALLVVLLGPNFPKTQTVADRGAAAEHYRELAPDSPDAWYQVGDWNFHFGYGTGVEDASRVAEEAFSRALALDSSFTPALEHLPNVYEATGDSAKLRRAIGLLAAGDSGNNLAGQRMMAAATLGDSGDVRALRAQIPRLPATALYDIVYGATAGFIGLDDADRAMAALKASAVTPYYRSQAALLDMVLQSDLGHPAKAAEALVKAGPSTDAQRVFGVIFWDWDTTGVADLARAVEAHGRAEATGGPRQRLGAIPDLSVAAEYHAWRGDARSFAQTADALRTVVFLADTSGYAGVRDRYQLVLDAQLASMTRRPDVRAVLTRADSVLKSDPDGQLRVLGNLIVARAWEAAGDLPHALAAVRRTESLNAPGYYFTTQLLEEGRLAALAGNRDLAIRSYRRYLALRRDADPALQGQVETVRRELQRLEAQASRSR